MPSMPLFWNLARRAPFRAPMVLSLILLPLAAASLPVAKPEDAGFSTERLRRVHEMMMRQVDAHDISGAVTMVARRGQVVHFEAHGLMDIESNKPMTKGRPIPPGVVIASRSPRRHPDPDGGGQTEADRPGCEYIPEFRNSKVAVEAVRTAVPMADQPPGSGDKYHTVPASRDITIIDLLTHTSGLASGGITDPTCRSCCKRRTPTETLADFIPRLGALALDFQPGTEWRYSGLAGFDTLGRIVEIVSGMSFDQFLRQRLFEPLGMDKTRFNVPEKEQARVVPSTTVLPTGWRSDRAARIGYAGLFFGRRRAHVDRLRLLQFAQMLCNGGQLNGKRFLSPWTVDLMPATTWGPVRRANRAAAEGRGVRAGRRGGGERGGSAHAQTGRQLRLGRRVRHLLVGEPQRTDGGHPCLCRRRGAPCSTISTTRYRRP